MGASTATAAQGRSTARLGAVQALYQMEFAGTDLADILADYGTRGAARADDGEEMAEADFAFFRDLVTGVVRDQREIDPKIDETLTGSWRLDRLDSILRAVLRAGTYELVARRDVPVKVVINEYLEVAHAFFDGDEAKLVNGVLDRLARIHRAGT